MPAPLSDIYRNRQCKAHGKYEKVRKGDIIGGEQENYKES